MGAEWTRGPGAPRGNPADLDPVRPGAPGTPGARIHRAAYTARSSNQTKKQQKHNLSFGRFHSFSGRSQPSDPFQRDRLEKSCTMQLKSAPEINDKAIWWPCPGLGQNQLKFKVTE